MLSYETVKFGNAEQYRFVAVGFDSASVSNPTTPVLYRPKKSFRNATTQQKQKLAGYKKAKQRQKR
jgi:hypothetical protein